MINRILMELYDDYKLNNNIDSINEFATKTFKNENARNIFIGSTLILFSRCNGFKARYDATRENLLDIVLLSKEKIEPTNLLKFYITRLNQEKRIVKIFKRIESEEDFQEGANIVIDYLEQFRPKIIDEVKKNIDKINEFVKKQK